MYVPLHGAENRVQPLVAISARGMNTPASNGISGSETFTLTGQWPSPPQAKFYSLSREHEPTNAVLGYIVGIPFPSDVLIFFTCLIFNKNYIDAKLFYLLIFSLIFWFR